MTTLRFLLPAVVASHLMAAPLVQAWTLKEAPLMTKWAKEVDPNAPLPEYPRPQLVREDWRNLNGLWEFQPGEEGDSAPIGKMLSGEILVPFTPESAISGVMKHFDRLWYRREFTVPTEWKGRQVILHFGAVDFESEVFVNGKSVGVHKGGYDPFSYDVTPYLKPSGPQELIVRVFDPTIQGGQPRGKQTTLPPGGIMYTPTTGIWQTVWIEPVSQGAVKDLKITPDVDAGSVHVTAGTYDPKSGDTVEVVVLEKGKIVGKTGGAPDAELSVPVPNAKLWSPDSPFLYDLEIRVTRGGQPVDAVKSYFGMRKIELAEVGNVKKILLNGKFVFQLGPLDQGFWPDGIYTAPTEDALKYDIEMTKKLGFNMTRKHIKVEPARWYYWTDRLGLLVWQDMPSANSYTPNTPPVDKEEYESELTRMIRHLYNTPSIIQWEIFNEGQGSHDQPRLVELVRKLDPTRLINEDSGGPQTGSGDVRDTHPYPAPICPQPSETQALVIGEFGGINLGIPGHMWSKASFNYTAVDSPEELVGLYTDYIDMLKQFRDERGLSAAVYTQITDVETELNGLMTYDRIPKMNVEAIAKANDMSVPAPVYRTVVPTSETESQPWRYTTGKPGPDWMKPNFNDSSWQEGKGGFGAPGTPGIGVLGTEWTSPAIWMRRTVKSPGLSAGQIENLVLRFYHDEDIEVFINGVPAYERKGFANTYQTRALSTEARKAWRPNAENLIAVSCKQTVGGQYIDAGVSIREPGK